METVAVFNFLIYDSVIAVAVGVLIESIGVEPDGVIALAADHRTKFGVIGFFFFRIGIVDINRIIAVAAVDRVVPTVDTDRIIARSAVDHAVI